jgi:peptidoglycan/LPS O-acetylase OafA/YrhL
LDALLAQALQMTNYYIIFGNADFTAPGLTVLWSLSVEEHFYLIFPLLFTVLAARFSAARMAGIIALICALVLLWRLTLVMGFHVPEIRTYYATDTRIDSIMFGAILALWNNPVRIPNLIKSNFMALTLLAASGVILIFCLIYRDPVFRETWRYSLQGLALFPIFYFAITKYQWPLFAWLNWGWVRYIGKVSYTAYLIHPTAIALSNKVFGEGLIPTFVGGLALTLGFSALMYVLVERHMSALRARLHQKSKA